MGASSTPRADALAFILTGKKAVVHASNYRELERELAAMTKERDSWKAKAEANERDAERYLAEIEMCAKRIFNRMYGSLPLGRRGKEFAQQEYDNLCRVLRDARSAEKEKE